VSREPILRIEFSKREREIAELIGDGESYDQIARSLTIAPCTVRTHVVRMSNKIDTFSEKPLPPRHSVYMYIMHERWSKRRAS
jgi:DNA-binding NarL/FixJ family response regulator